MDVDLDFLTRYRTTGFHGLLLRLFGIETDESEDEDELRRIGQVFVPDTFDPRVAGIRS